MLPCIENPLWTRALWTFLGTLKRLNEPLKKAWQLLQETMDSFSGRVPLVSYIMNLNNFQRKNKKQNKTGWLNRKPLTCLQILSLHCQCVHVFWKTVLCMHTQCHVLLV